MRHLFTTADARAAGITESALRWGVRTGRWRRIIRRVYGVGPEPPSTLDTARAHVLASGGCARGTLAGLLHGFDGVEEVDPDRRWRRPIPDDRITVVAGLPCIDALQTLLDLAAAVDDDTWEQALESALRQGVVALPELEVGARELGQGRIAGAARIRRVLAQRPQGAPPTESLLETLMVQLARRLPGLPPPTRQYVVVDAGGRFVARVDLCWPELGLFLELDGQRHKDQPEYDARRQTAVTAATGWLVGRFTWREVRYLPETTLRRLAELVEQARNRVA